MVNEGKFLVVEVAKVINNLYHQFPICSTWHWADPCWLDWISH